MRSRQHLLQQHNLDNAHAEVIIVRHSGMEIFNQTFLTLKKGHFLIWAHTHTCIFERLGSQILEHG